MKIKQRKNNEKDIIIDTSYNIKEIECDNSWIRDLDNDYFEYRRKWNLASYHHYLFDFPFFLEAESSYTCNYQCPKCPRQALQHTGKTGFLSNELFDKLFDEAKKYKMPAINFSHGGEPLMKKDIPELIRKAKEAFILDIMIHTNGSLLNEKLSIDLIESGLTKINFSLNAASPRVYRKMCSGGDYKKVLANIYKFLEVKKKIGKSYPRTRVSFIVCDENKHEQRKFFQFWKDKVNVIAFQQCYDFSEKKHPHSDKLKDYLKNPYCCDQLWQCLTITCEGDILACIRDYRHKSVLGNLKTHTIYQCWHCKTLNKMRKLHLENRWHEMPNCRRCVTSVQRINKNEIL